MGRETMFENNLDCGCVEVGKMGDFDMNIEITKLECENCRAIRLFKNQQFDDYFYRQEEAKMIEIMEAEIRKDIINSF